MARRSLAEMLVRRCTKCRKPEGEVSFPAKGQVCLTCIAERTAEWRQAHGKSGSYRDFPRKLGITAEEYAEYQHSNCGICGHEPTEDKPNTAYQNRRTGEPAGAICPKCVTALGCFNHDPERLRRALDYVVP